MEEYLFFLIIPYVILTVYRVLKKEIKWRLGESNSC